ncbi:hypothetical protein BKM77_07110 [Pseudomonas syringae]|nr:hypothetical protein AO388_16950 [Pseudomonas sp. ICMP 10191]RXF66007.1 hypothetical protein BKM77_07110 [Pseudomonas syringae]
MTRLFHDLDHQDRVALGDQPRQGCEIEGKLIAEDQVETRGLGQWKRLRSHKNLYQCNFMYKIFIALLDGIPISPLRRHTPDLNVECENFVNYLFAVSFSVGNNLSH